MTGIWGGGGAKWLWRYLLKHVKMAQKVIRNAQAPRIIPMIGPESNAIGGINLCWYVSVNEEVATIRRKNE
jgi:hypothetical protein